MGQKADQAFETFKCDPISYREKIGTDPKRKKGLVL